MRSASLKIGHVTSEVFYESVECQKALRVVFLFLFGLHCILRIDVSTLSVSLMESVCVWTKIARKTLLNFLLM